MRRESDLLTPTEYDCLGAYSGLVGGGLIGEVYRFSFSKRRSVGRIGSFSGVGFSLTLGAWERGFKDSRFVREESGVLLCSFI